MRRFVNGDEVELSESGSRISRLPDRLMVHGPEGSYTALAIREGDAVLVSYRGRQYRIERKAARARSGSSQDTGEIRAPMPGAIVDVRVSEGDSVSKGDLLVVLEAMKTQQPFAAPFDGVVASVAVAKGDQVADGQLLVKVSTATPE